MIIDGRGIQIEETLKKVREFLNTRCSLEDAVEVLLSSTEDAKKVKAYVSMTGCITEVKKIDDHYSMIVSGGTCRCG